MSASLSRLPACHITKVLPRHSAHDFAGALGYEAMRVELTQSIEFVELMRSVFKRYFEEAEYAD